MLPVSYLLNAATKNFKFHDVAPVTFPLDVLLQAVCTDDHCF